MTKYNLATFKQIENLLNVGIALSAEKEHNKVLEMILTEARRITRADAGTLYLYENNHLAFSFIQNETMDIYQGGDGDKLDLPPLTVSKDNVAGYTALTKSVVNIADVYHTDDFNFSGPKKYDSITGYKTTSMLVAPMVDHEEKVVGVLQLINARSEKGEVIPFASYYEKVIASLASQAAISVTNIRILQEVKNLLRGLVESMATAVDSRTPYNASHTLRITRLARKMIDVINSINKGVLAEEYFDKKREEQLVMSAWLHDIGKISVPLAVMDKSCRLEGRLELVLQRFDYIDVLLQKDLLQYKIEQQDKKNKIVELQKKLQLLEEARKLVICANRGDTFIDEDLTEQLKHIGSQTYVDSKGHSCKWLTDDELEALLVKRGTLTSAERKTIEDHVNIAVRILQAIPFPEKLNDVSKYVSMHHEYLDGSGYPQGLKGEEIPLEARILAIADIFDALVASDRPYKKAKPVEIALKILDSMVEEGKLDRELMYIFKKYKAWECLETENSDSYRIW